MDLETMRKWDANVRFYDFNTAAVERRWASVKKDFFSSMGEGTILFLAAGTGKDFDYFPTGRAVVAIDISAKMLEKAAPRADHYPGRIELRQMDARALAFPDETFDQIFTSCTFCSVPGPVAALKELKRVLKPGGELRMFEHTGSARFPFRQMLDLMNPLARRLGPSLNRDTVANVERAGLVIEKVTNIYLDIVKIIVAHKTREGIVSPGAGLEPDRG